MKKILKSSIVLILFAFVLLVFQASCTKDGIAQALLTKPQILVQKSWKLDQLHRVIDGVYASYYDGGANTTGVAYANLKYTFKADGTGTYIDQNKSSRAMVWQFTSADQREMKVTIAGAAAPDIWQMVEIAGSYVHVTENFTVGENTNNLHSFRLKQIP